jgi:acetyl/propionyl-CoA carboxylase alpha subunit/acetyl-CoA carboxylase carboxyltransferase component
MVSHILIANRGEIALRIAQAAADLALASTPLAAAEPAAYLDARGIIAAARRAGCDAVHPGYGFLSERADFAEACAAAGLVFIGPTPAQLSGLGDKVLARALATSCGVPVLPGSAAAVSLAEAERFMAEQLDEPVVLKAVGGGGGRGLRVVHDPETLPQLYRQCLAEAAGAFGHAELYVERFLPRSRHVEVQVLGDGVDTLVLGDRDCTLQRQHQKLVELAPAPRLAASLRNRLHQAALEMARAIGCKSLVTFEFLVGEVDSGFVFIEANPRLQVEHTVTEVVTGLDLVQLQIRVARGERLAALGLTRSPRPRGAAIQWRLNAEGLNSEGLALPAEGVVQRWLPPGGAGVRVDSALQVGQAVGGGFDSLLAKIVVSGPGDDLPALLRRSRRALQACVLEGVDHNLGLLQMLTAQQRLNQWDVHTALVQQLAALQPATRAQPEAAAHELHVPMGGRVVAIEAAPGMPVARGAPLALVEAMKMHHALAAPQACRVQRWLVGVGDSVQAGQLVALLEPAEHDEAAAPQPDDGPRADLVRVQARWARTQDAARPEAIARRHAKGGRSARDNVAATCDDGSFIEYGAFAVAAQRQRRSAEDLEANTPADGMVTGIGSVHGVRAVVMAYDATVLAGTQGARNHAKTDRLLGLALKDRLPVVLWAEGGGGRPGDVDMPIVAGLHVGTFASLARLAGQVPLVGIAAGRCFAGNAALLGCCDVVIATRNANIGMGGPAMIEGGGLGVFAPEQIGPAAVQAANGVVDVLVDDETAAAQVARQVLALLLQLPMPFVAADAPDALALRPVVPANRLRVCDMAQALDALFDRGSVLELGAGHGSAVITALARLEGRAVAVLASRPAVGGGAIDAAAAAKATRFIQLAGSFGLPLVSLIDTPGFMVGPASEEAALVRRAGELFRAAAAFAGPSFAVVLRRAYGLGAMALAAGGFHETRFTIAWPSAEFGAMGLEGAVRLGWRKELDAAAPGAERDALFARLLAAQVEAGGAIPMATTLEIDAVIDPADTRAWLLRGLAAAPPSSSR